MKKISDALCKVERPLEKAILVLIGIGMALITIIIFIQVVFRYFLGNSLSWSEELARYIEVWVVFLAAGYALGKGQHICMDLVVRLVPPLVKKVLKRINALVFIFFSLFMIRFSYDLIQSEWVQRMAAIDLPKWYVYLALLLGSVIMLFYSVLLLIGGGEEVTAR